MSTTLPSPRCSAMAPQVERLLECVWREQNVVDGHERPARLGHRSLSVGDVVQLGELAYAVQSAGWRQIDSATIRRAAPLTIHVDPRLVATLDLVLVRAEHQADQTAASSPLNSDARRDWQELAEAIYLARAAAKARAAAGAAEDRDAPAAG